MKYEIHHGDCIDVLRDMPDNSIDSVVTDPPYGLKFMNKKWDYDVPSTGIWEECLRVLKPGGHLLSFAGTRTQHRMAVRIEDAGFEIRDMIAWVYGSGFPKSHNLKEEWAGWGTTLKPAMEPITLARKPFKGPVANNVRQYATGALNIDRCRVAAGEEGGRWPANFIHDGSEEVMELFPNTKSGVMKAGTKRAAQDVSGSFCYGVFGGNDSKVDTYGDEGSAGRFFYCAKASKADREPGNNHPTVKPTDLMRYLCRLITPRGGIVLDPFMGSGSTGKGALLEDFYFIGIERELESVEIARSRLSHVNTYNMRAED